MSGIFRRLRRSSPSSGENAEDTVRGVRESGLSVENDGRRQSSDAEARRQAAENETRREASDAEARRQRAENETRREASDAEARRQGAENETRRRSGDGARDR